VAEDFDDRLRRHEEMIEGLTRVFMRQSEINEHIVGFIDEQRAMNERMDRFMVRMDGYMQRQEAINASVASTLERVETLLERLPRGGENGRREA